MNKNLLTLTGILSLLAANQAFGWNAPIKNETANNQAVILTWMKRGHSTLTEERVDIPAGKTVIISSRQSDISLRKIRDANGITYDSKQDKIGQLINPLKGLTIKTGQDDHAVIVENQ